MVIIPEDDKSSDKSGLIKKNTQNQMNLTLFYMVQPVGRIKLYFMFVIYCVF